MQKEFSTKKQKVFFMMRQVYFVIDCDVDI